MRQLGEQVLQGFFVRRLRVGLDQLPAVVRLDEFHVTAGRLVQRQANDRVGVKSKESAVEEVERRLVEGCNQRLAHDAHGRLFVRLGVPRLGVFGRRAADGQRMFFAVCGRQRDGQVRCVEAIFGRLFRLERLIAFNVRGGQGVGQRCAAAGAASASNGPAIFQTAPAFFSVNSG